MTNKHCGKLLCMHGKHMLLFVRLPNAEYSTRSTLDSANFAESHFERIPHDLRCDQGRISLRRHFRNSLSWPSPEKPSCLQYSTANLTSASQRPLPTRRTRRSTCNLPPPVAPPSSPTSSASGTIMSYAQANPAAPALLGQIPPNFGQTRSRKILRPHPSSLDEPHHHNLAINQPPAGVAQLVERVALMTAKRSTSRSWVRAPPSAIPISRLIRAAVLLLFVYRCMLVFLLAHV
jgi:hypothetical protein